jgi:prepilin-type N-terminal cleavage/methylation domain-containing protein/prepilin-type processing-associated H-X9-DG protein
MDYNIPEWISSLTQDIFKIIQKAGGGTAANKKRAFTLIELLVVIAIIALLMAILMSSLQVAKKQAQAVVCESNLKQWSLYFSIYTQENGGHFHRGWNVESDYQYSWIEVFRPFYKDDPDLTFCPTAMKPRTQGGVNPFSAWTWTNEVTLETHGSYGINIWVTDPRPGSVVGMPGEWYWRIRDVPNTNNIPLFMDSFSFDFRPHHTDQPPVYEGQVEGWGTNALKYVCQNRHSGNINILFMDFSVRPTGLKKLWRLKWNRNFDLSFPLPDWPDWMRSFPDP